MIDPKQQSMIFEREIVKGVLEYAEDEMLVTVDPDVLIVKNWDMVMRIVDPDEDNTNKFQICPMEGFHPDSFPFVALSGKNHLMILNLFRQRMEILV